MVAHRLGVLGWPVAHSRSPAIHNAALAAAGLRDWRYQLLPVAPELFAELLPALPAAGFIGANVTIPHKHAALALSTSATDRARAIGAANTLSFDPAGGGEIVADNTDAPGLIASLPLDPRGRRALVLGAGGSARAVVWALVDAGAADVRVWNRTAPRADALAADFGATPVTAAQLAIQPTAHAADIVVNCTAAGLDGRSSFAGLPLDPDGLGEFGCVVDLVYTDAGTDLLARARAAGVPAVDGLEVLIAQGALSFERFTGVPASVEAMRAAVARDPS